MKIKVVDMPYEQALAQPREKHTPPRRPSMLFRALLRALSAPDLRATHFRCDRVGMERLGPDEPCLVLMNHSCFLDLKIAAAVLYPRPFNIVCTSDGFVGKAGLMRATRGYKDINLLAMKMLRPNGLLATFSCSGAMTPDLFDKVCAEAAFDAKRAFQIVARTRQAAGDHPVGLSFPEGLYLKGLLLRAIG